MNYLLCTVLADCGVRLFIDQAGLNPKQCREEINFQRFDEPDKLIKLKIDNPKSALRAKDKPHDQ